MSAGTYCDVTVNAKGRVTIATKKFIITPLYRNSQIYEYIVILNELVPGPLVVNWLVCHSTNISQSGYHLTPDEYLLFKLKFE